MAQQNTEPIKEKIVSVLKRRGPSLPVHISREIGQSMLFTSAFLSELISDKRIKTSNLKIGSSPLYLIPGQEKRLEDFERYVKGREREAFDLLKEKKILKDSKQEPAIRVALRAIKDFSFSLEVNGELYWRYFTLPEEEEKKKIIENRENSSNTQENTNNTEDNKKEVSSNSPEETPKKTEKKKKNQKTEEREEKQKSKEKEVSENKEKTTEKELNIFDKNPKKKSSKKKKKKKSKFVLDVLDYLNENNLPVDQEIGFKKREYTAIIEAKSSLGKVKFLLYAKDKKKITTDDIVDLVLDATKSHMNALFITTGELNKKAQNYASQNSSILKIKKL